MPIHIVTDSTCDLPATLVDQYQVHVVPAAMVIEGQTYRDGIDLSREEFYQRLPTWKRLPQTASPAAGEFEALYRQFGSDEIISLHTAAAFSGIFNAARLGAEAAGARVTLVDSGTTSVGLGWQVLAAAEAVQAGHSVNEAVAVSESTQRRLKVWAALDTIEYLRRGGRANAIVAILGDLLQIKLVIEVVNSKITPLTRLRTRGKMIDKLAELAQTFGPLDRLAVMYSKCLPDGQALAERLVTSLGPLAQHSPLVIEATPVIGTHVGPQALGIAAVKAA